MSRRNALWASIAVVTAVGFFWAATTQSVYDHTSPGGVAVRVFGEDAARVPHQSWLSLHIVLRKAYSIVAFAIVGFALDQALPAARRRVLRAALIVATYSALIEVGQWMHYVREGFASNLFDIGCGAVGGWLAVVVARAPALARKRSRTAVDVRLRVERGPYGE